MKCSVNQCDYGGGVGQLNVLNPTPPCRERPTQTRALVSVEAVWPSMLWNIYFYFVYLFEGAQSTTTSNDNDRVGRSTSSCDYCVMFTLEHQAILQAAEPSCDCFHTGGGGACYQGGTKSHTNTRCYLCEAFSESDT